MWCFSGRNFTGQTCSALVAAKLGLAALATAVWLTAAPTASAQEPDSRAMTNVTGFPDCCPRPVWWNEVEVGTRITSMETYRSVWQNRELTDRQKAKALFRAIEDFAHRDDDITAAAVNYFYWVGRDYQHIRSLYEFGAVRYLDYHRPLKNYAGKSGDMSAGMVNNLAKIYLRQGEPERAVPWLRYILDEREADVNDHLLETAAAHLGDALTRLGRRPEAIEVLLAARRDYDGDWEKRLNKQLADLRSDMGLSYHRHDTSYVLRAVGVAAGVAIVAALVSFILRRRRKAPGKVSGSPSSIPQPPKKTVQFGRRKS